MLRLLGSSVFRSLKFKSSPSLQLVRNVFESQSHLDAYPLLLASQHERSKLYGSYRISITLQCCCFPRINQFLCNFLIKYLNEDARSLPIGVIMRCHWAKESDGLGKIMRQSQLPDLLIIDREGTCCKLLLSQMHHANTKPTHANTTTRNAETELKEREQKWGTSFVA